MLAVHAVGTTGMDAPERRKFEYSDTCAQCGARLTPETRVAAHVLIYPLCCLNFCCAFSSLVTTCKSCNAKNRSGKRCVDGESGACVIQCQPCMGCVAWPCCVHRDFG